MPRTELAGRWLWNFGITVFVFENTSAAVQVRTPRVIIIILNYIAVSKVDIIRPPRRTVSIQISAEY